MTVQEMLSRLFQLGLSQADVAKQCGTTQPTISRAANGAAVRYELGKSIEKLLEQQERGVGEPNVAA
ncbi:MULTISPECIES: helix-turn-helix domain-containing protein [unclassified Pseudomonas]|uniref:helix-turn-helix domain-containing protein n=1 Tax=unclassified Pseudomonas TaxID=196821 RepID=UPI0021BB4920|nr:MULTISPECIES: helix-turn-helix domain-containing protein [unclassified Pseudomonas]MCT8164985.1 helix-turn-helix domain-containing protein [Pseudomonas sp. HD6422]MCT8183883.1 helix-turn-helix domain-containing protein [Pseudomonas sp. HD6421]